MVFISNYITIFITIICSPQVEKQRHKYLKTYIFMLAWLAKQQPFSSSLLLTAWNLVKHCWCILVLEWWLLQKVTASCFRFLLCLAIWNWPPQPLHLLTSYISIDKFWQDTKVLQGGWILKQLETAPIVSSHTVYQWESMEDNTVHLIPQPDDELVFFWPHCFYI